MSDALTGWPFKRALDEFMRHGVEGIEVTAGPDGHASSQAGSSVREVAHQLDASGLTVCALAATPSVRLGDDGLRAVLEVAELLGVAAVRVFAGIFDPDVSVERQLDAVASHMRLLQIAGPYGIEILLEPAPGTIIACPEIARRVLDASEAENIGVVYDPASLAFEGHQQSAMAVGLFGSYLKHVHVKNQILQRRDGSWTAGPASLSAGVIDWPSTCSVLHRADYRGWWSIDHLSGPPSSARLAADLRALRNLVHRLV